MTELDTDSSFGHRMARFWEKLIWRVCHLSFLPRPWQYKLRKRFGRRITGPFDIKHNGMKFRLYPAENYCDRILFGRDELPEKREHEALLPLITPGMVFVDIGANVGTYSIFAGTKAKGTLTLLALEPHPRTYQKLVYNLQANGLSTSHIHNVGVGPERGKLVLWSDGGSNIGHTSMLKAGTSNPKVSHEVPVAPLAELLDENNIAKIDLLKIDIEGFEDRALTPFFDTANEILWPTHILIETAHQHLWQRDLMAMLEDNNYRVIFQTAENKLLSRTKDR